MGEERIGRCLAQAEEAGITSGESTSELDMKASCHWVSYCDLEGVRVCQGSPTDLVSLWPRKQQD